MTLKELQMSEQQKLDLIEPATQPKRRTRTVLTPSEYFRLIGYVEREYATSKLTDVAFAQSAALALGIPEINKNHVETAREHWKLPSNRDVAREEKKKAPQAEAINGIESRVLSLEKQVRKLFAQQDALENLKGKDAPSDEELAQFVREYYGGRHNPTSTQADLLLAKAVLREFA